MINNQGLFIKNWRIRERNLWTHGRHGLYTFTTCVVSVVRGKTKNNQQHYE